MMHVVFQCMTLGCTSMIRCLVSNVHGQDQRCKWCQSGTAYYADGTLRANRNAAGSVTRNAR